MIRFLKISITVLLCTILAITGSGSLLAQAPGSEETNMGYFSIANTGTSSSVSETLYLGPGTYEINGTWEIYSKKIVIDPAAIITGSGTIHIFNPSVAGGATSRTYIDGNTSSNAINVNIVLHNPSGMELKNIDFSADLVAFGFINITSSSTYIGKNFDLAVDGADIWLDVDAIGNLRFGNGAAISNYSADRMIITNNSIVSHVVRDAGGTGFFFPVGIADGDYTPANIVGNGEYNVSVIDYTASTPTITNPAEGMGRTWHIFGDAATTIALHHNSGGAMSTNGSAFIDAAAFITRYQGSGVWSTGIAEQTSAGVHTNTGVIGSGVPSLGTSNDSWLTKSSDAITPLPVKFLHFYTTVVGNTALLIWATASEQNNQGFEIEHSNDGNTWHNVGFVVSKVVNGNSSIKLDYNFTHSTPLQGINFYRLKQVDINGNYEYSAVVKATFANKTKINIYPNPAISFIMVNGLNSGETIYITNTMGQKLITHKALAGNSVLDLKTLNSGIYIVSVVNEVGEILIHKKLIKK